MRIISAIFLVLLCVPFVFSKTDIMELLQKTPEGQEILDHIMLDVSLDGRRLNARAVAFRLKQMAKGVRKSRIFAYKIKKMAHKFCRKFMGAAKSRYHDFVIRFAAFKREIITTRSVLAGRIIYIKRFRRETAIYKKFFDMNRENQRAWHRFWKKGRRIFKTLRGIIFRLRTHIHRLHRRHRRHAFIELPSDFKGALSEITSEFEKTTDGLDGLRPVVANLLEIVSSKRHLRKKKSRRFVRRLLRKLAMFLYNKSLMYAEEQEHQKNLFSSVGGLFLDRLRRNKGVLRSYIRLQKAEKSKEKWLRYAIRGIKHLLHLSSAVLKAKLRECHLAKRTAAKNIHRLRRIAMFTYQCKVVLASRFKVFRGAVLKRK